MQGPYDMLDLTGVVGAAGVVCCEGLSGCVGYCLLVRYFLFMSRCVKLICHPWFIAVGVVASLYNGVAELAMMPVRAIQTLHLIRSQQHHKQCM